jgi:putative oxidoreductase
MFWGLMAALIETLGGFLLVVGLAFRPVFTAGYKW